jgi:Phage integrase family/Pentapeptide repeats (8 copies)
LRQEADLSWAILCQANLSGANLYGAIILNADLIGANLSGAHLVEANLSMTNLTGANLRQAGLVGTVLLNTNLRGATLTGSIVHGASVWDTKVDEQTNQQNLVITPGAPGESKITVDNIKVAQFIYLLITNKEIRDVIEEHLLAIAGDNPRGFLCPTLAGQRISGGKGLSLQFAALMGKAGIDQRRIQSSRNRKFSRLSFHSLRHSFSSALANAGISADVRMRLTGHKSLDVHRRYTHVEMEPLKHAIAALPRLAGEKKRERRTIN